ncbi:hypothetical protein V1514DRAFT_330981 [Lipomyces japonicus]|uniref:uncharacterized protein n=1 Tax=Lipomyces japonicus TaxID=56871 RepID=UPI0034CD90CF
MAYFSSLLVLLAAASTLVLGAPSLDFPVSEQYPPVARLNKAYAFTLSSYTFTSTGSGNISYQASNLPSWLSFDNSSLEFSGTPTSSADVGFPTFDLIATDSADEASATDHAELAVSSNDAPAVEFSCVKQLQDNFTTFSGAGFSLTPGKEFALHFANDTFDGDVQAIYGLFSGHTPLPSWVSFDSQSMTFYGSAPVLSSSIAPPLSFVFTLIATDIAGFSAAESSFAISVGDHSLTANSVNVNATEGEYFESSLDIQLDGNAIDSTNVTSVNVNGTESWMTFNQDNFTLSGTPRSDDVGNATEVQVSVVDVYGDEVQVFFNVIVESSLNDNSSEYSIFGSAGLSNITAQRGQDFNYTLKLSSKNISSISAAFVPSSASSWLSFDNDDYKLSGRVPDQLSDVEVVLTASSNSGNQETAEFFINGNGTVTITSSATASATSSVATWSASASQTASAASSTTTTTSGTTSDATVKKSNNKTVAIALGVIIPLAVLAAAGILFYCCCITGAAGRRRQRRNSQASSKTATSSPNRNISKPIPIEDDWPLPPTPPGKIWAPVRRLSGMSMFSSHRRTYSDLEKHAETGGFVIPYDPDDPTRPRRSRMFTKARDSLASLATVATNEIFSVRLVESSQGDIAGLAGNKASNRSSVISNTRRSRSNRSIGSSDSGGSATIGPYSTSSGDSTAGNRLHAVREEDISEDMVGLVRPPVVDHNDDDSDALSTSDVSSQQFEIVSGEERSWRHKSSLGGRAGENEPRLVDFPHGGRPANRRSVGGASADSDDGQVFL